MKTLFSLFFTLILFSPLSFGETQYQFERMWPNLPQPWYFQDIENVTIDELGFIWLIDERDGVKKIYKYNSDGYLLKTFSPQSVVQQIADSGFEGSYTQIFGDKEPVLIKANGSYIYTLGTTLLSSSDLALGLFQFDNDFNFIQFIRLNTRRDSYSILSIKDFAISDDYIALLRRVEEKELEIYAYEADGKYIKTRWILLNHRSQVYDRLDIKGDWIFAQEEDGCFSIQNIHRNISKPSCVDWDMVGRWDNGHLEDFYPISEDGVIDGGYAFYEKEVVEEGKTYYVARVSKVDAEHKPIWTTEITRDYLSSNVPLMGRITAINNSKLLIGTNQGVQLLDLSGKKLASFSATGSDYGRYAISNRNNIAVNDSYIATIEAEDGIVKLYNYQGMQKYEFSIDETLGKVAFVTSEILQIDDQDQVYVVQNRTVTGLGSTVDLIVKYDKTGKVQKEFILADEAAKLFKISSLEIGENGSLHVGVDFTPATSNCTDCGNNIIRYYELDNNGVITHMETLYDPATSGLNLQYKQSRGVFKVGSFIYLATEESSSASENGRQHTFEIYLNGELMRKVENFYSTERMISWQDGFLLLGRAGNGLGFVDYQGVVNTTTLELQFPEGALPGQLGMDNSKWVHDAAITANHFVIFDAGNYRLQLFKKVDKLTNTKAIIVAGGGPYPGNSLWNATLANANFAYRTLISQGYRKEQIKYFANENFDLDSNGEKDDFAGDATIVNLEKAFTEWAVDADNLVVYFIDHGGDRSFRLGEHEVLSAERINNWFTQLEGAMSGGITLVYDACKSGTFIESLNKSNRTIITSAKGQQNAYFLSQGSVSFSSFFWQNIFNGQTLADAFSAARDTIHSYDGLTQQPQIAFNGQLLSNDLSALGNRTIGSGTVHQQSAPTITTVSSSQTILETSEATIEASVETDLDGISRVWGVIWPPNYVPPDAVTPVLDLPTIELKLTTNGTYSGTYKNFVDNGTYHIAVYARDGLGNTSTSKSTSVTVGSMLNRKAVILGGGKTGIAQQTVINSNLHLAYHALKQQGYDDERIYYVAAEATNVGVDGLNTLGNVQYGLTTWVGNDTADLVVYLAGPGDFDGLKLNDGQLKPSLFGVWLQTVSKRIKGTMTVVLDTHYGGHWLSKLAAQEDDSRIVISSTGVHEFAYWLDGATASFSEYFWRQVQSGSSVREAYIFATLALDLPGVAQTPQMDDNLNGISNEKTDGRLARIHWLGSGIATAGDEPVISQVREPVILNGESAITLYAQGISSTSPVTNVEAVVTPPHTEEQVSQSVIIPLFDGGNGRYEGLYNEADNNGGLYGVSYTAVNGDGYESLPVSSHFIQSVGADVYEVDDSLSQAMTYSIDVDVRQWRTLHTSRDSDWVKVYLGSKEFYTFSVGDVGTRLDPQIQLYDATGSLVAERDQFNQGEPESLKYYNPPAGFYYVKITHSDEANYRTGSGMEYTLTIESELSEFEGDLVGLITYSDGNPVDGLPLTTSRGVTGITMPNGAYKISHAVGDYELLVTVPGGEEKYPFTIEELATSFLDIVIPTGDVAGPQLTVPQDLAILVTDNEPLHIDSQDIARFLFGASATTANGAPLSVSHNAPDYFEVGATTVLFSATDNGQTVTDSAIVWIDFIDTVKPIVTPPNDIVVSAGEIEQVTAAHPLIANFLAKATATDVVDGQLPVTHTTPEPFLMGENIVVFSAKDESGNTGQASAIVTIVINTAPVFTSTPRTKAVVDVRYQYVLAATDAENESVQYASVLLPGWLSINGNKLTGTPRHAHLGNHDVVVSATDGHSTTLQSFNIIVSETSMGDADSSALTWLWIMQLLDMDRNKKASENAGSNEN